MIVITYGRHHLWLSPLMIVYMDGCFMDDCHLTVWRGLIRLLLSLPPLLFLLSPLSSQIRIRVFGAAHCRWVFQCCFTAAASTAFHWHYVHLSIEKEYVHTFFSYLPRLHNKLDYVRLSTNLYIHHVRLSRNLYIHYVRLSTSLSLSDLCDIQC